MKTIKKFGVIQTAKVTGIIYFLLGIAIVIPMYLFMSIMPNTEETEIFGSGMVMILIPIFYGIIGFVFTAIGCMIYNFVAARIGGITIEVETTD